MATKKCRESDFCKMSPVHSADTLWVQNFVEIALSHTISEMNVLLRFTQKFNMDVYSPVDSAYILWDKKFRQNHSIMLRVRDKCF